MRSFRFVSEGGGLSGPFPGVSWATAALSAALVLCSCAPRLAYRVQSSRPDLGAAIAELAGQYGGQRGATLTAARPEQGPRGCVVDIAWRLGPNETPAGASTDPGLPAVDRLGTALVLQRWAQGSRLAGELPLLWDPWGVWGERDAVEAALPGGGFSWADRSTLEKRRLGIVVGGGDAGGAQAFYWLVAPAGDTAANSDAGFASDTKRWNSETGRRSFAAFAAALADRSILPGSQHFSRADQEARAREPGPLVYLVPFSLQFHWTWGASKSFAALVAGDGPARAMVASILCARIEGGTRRERRAAADFIAWLLAPSQQRLLQDRTGLLSVNFAAPNLNGAAKVLRDRLLAAASLDPVVPEPADPEASRWSALISSIVASPASWEAHLRESSR